MILLLLKRQVIGEYPNKYKCRSLVIWNILKLPFMHKLKISKMSTKEFKCTPMLEITQLFFRLLKSMILLVKVFIGEVVAYFLRSRMQFLVVGSKYICTYLRECRLCLLVMLWMVIFSRLNLERPILILRIKMCLSNIFWMLKTSCLKLVTAL